MEDLEEAGIIHHVQEKRREGYVPAAPAEAMPTSDIIKMVLGPAQKGDFHHPLALMALNAALAAVEDKRIEMPTYLGRREEGLPKGISQTTLFPREPVSVGPKNGQEETPP
ncbi:MAG: hypothetical protein P8130_11835 [Deltaproteobacteria bacterium]